MNYVISIDLQEHPNPETEKQLVELFRKQNLFYVYLYASPLMLIYSHQDITWDSVDPKFKTMLALLL